MVKEGVAIFSICTGYIATINIWKMGYEMYLGVVDDLYSLVIALGCAIINILRLTTCLTSI
jgi:hypothetical protein